MADSLRNRVRVGGSGFTVFTFQSQPIAFAQQVAHTSPQPVAQPVPIQPMDEPYPVQVITPAASGMGTLVLNLYELYGSKVWERLGAKAGTGAVGSSSANVPYGSLGGDSFHSDGFLYGAVDLVDIMIRVAQQPNAINVSKFIRPPKLYGNTQPIIVENYHNCVITNVIDGEQIDVGSMEVLKQITVAYTHMTNNSGSGSAAWDLRDRPLS